MHGKEGHQIPGIMDAHENERHRSNGKCDLSSHDVVRNKQRSTGSYKDVRDQRQCLIPNAIFEIGVVYSVPAGLKNDANDVRHPD